MCKKTINIIITAMLLLLCVYLYSCASKSKKGPSQPSDMAAIQQQQQQEQVALNRGIEKIVLEAIEVIIDNKDIDKIPLYFSTNYIEYHGKSQLNYFQFSTFVANTVSMTPKRVVYHKAVEGNTVALYSKLFDSDFSYDAVDFFEVNGNKIISRRSFSQEASVSSDATTATSLIESNDADPNITSLTRDFYKQQVQTLYTDIYPNVQIEAIDSIFSDDFIQHNPQLPPGKQGIIDLLSLGPIVHRIKQIVTEQDMVFVLLENSNGTVAYAHVFKFSPNGFILENWSVSSTLQ